MAADVEGKQNWQDFEIGRHYFMPYFGCVVFNWNIREVILMAQNNNNNKKASWFLSFPNISIDFNGDGSENFQTKMWVVLMTTYPEN